jgi:hypothetical protein
MFTFADKATMLNEVDPAVIIRVVSEINEVHDNNQDLEKIEKNS